MKKVITVLAIFAMGFPLLLKAMNPDKNNLIGMNYARIQVEFNGTPYYKGYKNPKAEETVEFNLEAVKTTLDSASIPLKKEFVRASYDQMVSMLEKAGLHIVYIKSNEKDSSATILPTVSVRVEVMAASPKLYFTLVSVTVSQWMSTWAGTKNIQTPVISWWQKKMLAAEPKELNNSINTAVQELLEEFIRQFQEANPPEESQEKK